MKKLKSFEVNGLNPNLDFAIYRSLFTRMNILTSIHWLLAGAVWYGINGLLHDFFVIRSHKTGYDKQLMRLLLDGHLLILSGVLMFVGWMMLRSGNSWGAAIGLITGISMIIYCAMIFPFLKSFGTLFISIVVSLVCLTLSF